GIARRGLLAGALVGRGIEAAEMAREGEQIVVGQLLLAEYQYVIAIPGLLDRIDLGRAQASEIDAFYFSAHGSGRLDFHARYYACMKSAGFLAAVDGVVCVCNISLATAQSYPNRSVRLVVDTSPGGITDILARLSAEGLTQKLGQ